MMICRDDPEVLHCSRGVRSTKFGKRIKRSKRLQVISMSKAGFWLAYHSAPPSELSLLSTSIFSRIRLMLKEPSILIKQIVIFLWLMRPRMILILSASNSLWKGRRPGYKANTQEDTSNPGTMNVRTAYTGLFCLVGRSPEDQGMGLQICIRLNCLTACHEVGPTIEDRQRENLPICSRLLFHKGLCGCCMEGIVCIVITKTVLWNYIHESNDAR
ncbi:hypothetical protein V8F44DRAFT_631579 [Aspergillus fumigatus]